MRSFWRRLCAIMALAICLGSLPAMGEGMYYGSRPGTGVYVTQTRKHTCTLIAATMMLRNYSYQRGGPYEMVDEWSVGFYAWGSYGLARSFAIGRVQIAQSTEIQTARDKKRYLIDQLIEHPEGFVIYDTGAPHAIFLFGYDEELDIFYCADTIRSRGGRPIKLERSIIRGLDQQAKVNTIDKIWYIVDPERAEREA